MQDLDAGIDAKSMVYALARRPIMIYISGSKFGNHMVVS